MSLSEDMDYQETVFILGVLMIFTNHRVIEACRGPGPVYHHRSHPTSLVPLKLHQHIPNISEKTIGASGPAEGKITRKDERFKDLVLNVNPNIVFRNEENTDADNRMTKRCKDRLNTLALLVARQWDGVKLRVSDAWEEDNGHEEGSLHYEGRAVDITTSPTDRKKYGHLARLAVEAGFDWVHYDSEHYVHASVVADDVESDFAQGCFPKDSLVTMEDGAQRKMADLKVGDKVLTLDRTTGERKATDVILMMHQNANKAFKFLKITAETNTGHQSLQRQVLLTPNHLIYKHISVQSERWQPRAVFAEDVDVGDLIYFNSFEVTNSTDFVLAKVTATELLKAEGVFAPLTVEGSIIVNGIAASSYAVYNNEDISHALFYPLRLLWRWGFRWSDSSSSDTHTTDVHWYPKSIFHVATAILPKGVLNP